MACPNVVDQRSHHAGGYSSQIPTWSQLLTFSGVTTPYRWDASNICQSWSPVHDVHHPVVRRASSLCKVFSKDKFCVPYLKF